MSRDTRTRLREIARHRRDEEAARLRRLRGRLAEIDESLSALRDELARSEMALRERLIAPFERINHESYIAGLRERLQAMEEQRTEVCEQRDAVQKQLKQRVVRHRQMDHVVQTATEELEKENDRQAELVTDELASGHWHMVKVRKGD